MFPKSREVEAEKAILHFKTLPFPYNCPIADNDTILAEKLSNDCRLELQFQCDLLYVTEVWLLAVALFNFVSSTECIRFHDHTNKQGKNSLKNSNGEIAEKITSITHQRSLHRLHLVT